jgi:hypothetical protein
MAPAGGLDPSFQTNQERAAMGLPVIFAVSGVGARRLQRWPVTNDRRPDHVQA